MALGATAALLAGCSSPAPVSPSTTAPPSRTADQLLDSAARSVTDALTPVLSRGTNPATALSVLIPALQRSGPGMTNAQVSVDSTAAPATLAVSVAGRCVSYALHGGQAVTPVRRFGVSVAGTCR